MPRIPFTKETASLMAKRSHELRKARAQEEAANVATIEPEPSRTPNGSHHAISEYISGRLMRVRKQLAMLDRMLEQEESAQAIDRLASAIAKLSELERTLAGRPLPGSFRPTQRTQRGHSSGQSAAPLDVDE